MGGSPWAPVRRLPRWRTRRGRQHHVRSTVVHRRMLMRLGALSLAVGGVVFISAGVAGQAVQPPPAAEDPIAQLVGRLDLERYKETIRGLTQFGDRRQGTERNRDAVDWIEEQLQSYGCPTERLYYEYDPPE